MGRHGIKILPDICSEAELMVAMECTPLKKGFKRLNAIHLLMIGVESEKVLKNSNISRRMFYTWIHRFNTLGLDGLIHKPRPGRPRILNAEMKDKIIELLEDPSIANETHWTAVKLHGYISKTLDIKLGYSSLVRNLHEENYNLRVPRRWPEKQNEEQRKAFKIELEILSNDDTNEIWYQDECGIEGDPKPRRRWTKRGHKGTVPYLGSHIRHNILGAVCPKTGEFVGLIFDFCDTAAFQKLIDEIAKKTRTRSNEKKIYVILDNASWHVSSSINWQHIEPMFLPAYSPDLNPIERFWERLKQDYFYDFIAKTPEELMNRICFAIKTYLQDPSLIISTCKFRK